MGTLALKNILKEYEQKRTKNILVSEKKIADFYLKNPNLEKITENINKTSIEISKTILLDKNNKNKLNLLNKHLEDLKKERASLLKKLKISEDFFNPDFDCKLCNDTGYLENSQMCSCLKQAILNFEYNKSNISSLEYENFNNFNLNLFSDEIDEKKYNSKISPRENIKDIKDAALNFIENFDDENTKNLIFSGGTGLGKTYLSNCIINELLKNGKTVMYQTAPIMLDDLISDMFQKNENQIGISKKILNADLLVIEDLDSQNLNSMKFTELYKIINARLLSTKTKTIISTNLDLKGLFQTYDERLASRFVGYYDIYRFYGDDIRLKK
jgi:DNA replication protein DnaC